MMSNSNPPTDSSDASISPVPNTPLDAALLVVALRRVIVAWRERGAAAPEREARVYRLAEADVTEVITGHGEMRAVWSAARQDLVCALVEALDGQPGSRT